MINFVLGLFDLAFYMLFLFFLSSNIYVWTGMSKSIVGPTMAAKSYFAFLLIGVSLWPYASISLFRVANAIRSEQTIGTIEPLFVTPVSLRTYAAGSLLWSFLRTSITVMILVLSGKYFFDVPLTVSVVSMPALLLVMTSMVVSLLAFGLMIAGLRLIFKTADPLSFLFNWFNTFISGVYFPITVLPSWVQSVSLAHPLTHALRAYRSILLEGALLSDAAVMYDIASMSMIGLILLPLGYFIFKYCFFKARKDASLRQY